MVQGAALACCLVLLEAFARLTAGRVLLLRHFCEIVAGAGAVLVGVRFEALVTVRGAGADTACAVSCAVCGICKIDGRQGAGVSAEWGCCWRCY